MFAAEAYDLMRRLHLSRAEVTGWPRWARTVQVYRALKGTDDAEFDAVLRDGRIFLKKKGLQ